MSNILFGRYVPMHFLSVDFILGDSVELFGDAYKLKIKANTNMFLSNCCNSHYFFLQIHNPHSHIHI